MREVSPGIQRLQGKCIVYTAVAPRAGVVNHVWCLHQQTHVIAFVRSWRLPRECCEEPLADDVLYPMLCFAARCYCNKRLLSARVSSTFIFAEGRSMLYSAACIYDYCTTFPISVFPSILYYSTSSVFPSIFTPCTQSKAVHRKVYSKV